MGERLLCKQEVVGSIPSASTSLFWCRGDGGLPREIRQKETQHGNVSFGLLIAEGTGAGSWTV